MRAKRPRELLDGRIACILRRILSAAPSLPASRLGLLGAFVLIAAITIVALAPQQWAAVASMAVTEGLPLLAWLLAGYGFGSLVLRRDPDTSANVLIDVTRIAFGLGAVSLATLLLGVLGILNQFAAVAIILIGASLAVRRIYNNRNIISTWLRESPGAGWLLLLIAPVAGITFLGGCILPGVLWGLDDPSGYDVVAYHLQLPREWFELGRVTTLTHNVFSFFPLNVEMHYLLAMHLRGGPWAGMYLAQLMHGSFIALTVAAVYGAAESRGRLAASVAAIVCASVPWMLMLGSVAYVEGGLLLYATLAMAWAIRGRWGLAGACAGLACGCKLTGVPLTALIAGVSGSLSLWERVRVRDSAISNSRLEIGENLRPHPSPLPEGEGVATALFFLTRNIALFGAVALLVFSPWLLRTAIATHGNPIFPLAQHTLGHAHFDAGQTQRFEVAHAPRDDQRSLASRLDALFHQVGGAYQYGTGWIGGGPATTCLLVFGVAPFIAWRQREMYAWLAVIVGSAVVWLFATHLQGRFLVQIIPLAAVMTSYVWKRVGELRYGTDDASTVRTDDARPVLSYGRQPESKWGPRVTLACMALGIAVSLALVGPHLYTKFHLTPEAAGVDGVTSLRQFLPEPIAAAVYDTTRPIYLVGDAKAFWYAIPSSRLHYRSVFDVPASKSFHDAWLGDDVPGDAIVIVDLGELGRFARTYRNLPALPKAWRDRGDIFAVNAADVPR